MQALANFVTGSPAAAVSIWQPLFPTALSHIINSHAGARHTSVMQSHKLDLRLSPCSQNTVTGCATPHVHCAELHELAGCIAYRCVQAAESAHRDLLSPEGDHMLQSMLMHAPQAS